ncbi:antibiotic biosynthesis monooxygenase [Pseudoduganella lutea]|uniref:Antibiotic biosynthesis monooxygenase n=2 Tax=Pseudoduganella lutea TaxID=321985 RepID=A0A4P6L791_9BURK|nr:antibiotic biosynthesis monooxygenase [Pseudoduganella lutea]
MGLPKTHGHPFPNPIRKFVAVAATTFLLGGVNVAQAQGQELMVRISEIEVDAKYLEQYKAILEDEAEASVRLEPGVIAIFPMYRREKDTEFRILEMYASREAYEAHLKTPHFQKYKSGTLHMVKSLKLVDMQPLDAATMTRIFRKSINNQ